MKYFKIQTIFTTIALGAAAIFAGCSSNKSSITAHGVQGLSANPPAFLAGPGGVLLTNQDGFSAHVLITTPVPGSADRSSSGELVGRDGRFLYTPTSGIGVTKLTRKSGKAMSFIWDVPKNLGYALNEALQAYAPLNASVEVTNVQWDAKLRVSDSVNGHPCHKGEVTISARNGVSVHFAVWRADDAQQFPVRIQTLDGARPNTVDFFNIRYQTLPADALRPPDEFRKYDTADMMVNELMIRETTTAKKKGQSDFSPDDSMPDDNSRWGHRPGQ